MPTDTRGQPGAGTSNALTAPSGLRLEGYLRLEARGRDWNLEKRAPLNCTVIRMADHLLAIPSDASGGLRGGDKAHIEIVVRDGANLVWQAPGASLIFPASAGNGPDESCSLTTAIHVGVGASLVFLARPIIPCKGSRLGQKTDIALEAGAQFFYSDAMMAGRIAAGESFAFHSLHNQLDLTVENHLLYREAWHCDPAAFHPRGPAGFGNYVAWGTTLACGHTKLAERETAYWIQMGCEYSFDALDTGIQLGRFGSSVPFDRYFARFGFS